MASNQFFPDDNDDLFRPGPRSAPQTPSSAYRAWAGEQGMQVPRSRLWDMGPNLNPGYENAGQVWQSAASAGNNPEYTTEALFGQMPSSLRQSLGANLTTDYMGRQVISVNQTVGQGNYQRQETFNIWRDAQTGMTTIGNAASPAGGYVVGGEYNIETGQQQASSIDVLFRELGAGANDPSRGMSARFQQDNNANYIFFRELSPQSRAKWSTFNQAVTNYRDPNSGQFGFQTDGGFRGIGSQDMTEAMRQNTDLGWRGQGSHFFSVRALSSANFPVDDQGYVWGGKSVKREQNQGVHETFPLHSVMGVAAPQYQMPARNAGAVEASTGYRLQTGLILHGGVITPEGQSWMRQDLGYLPREYVKRTKLTDDQLRMAQEGNWDAALGRQAGDVFSFGNTDPTDMLRGDRFRGHVREIEGLDGGDGGSYSHARIAGIRLTDDGYAEETFHKYIPAWMASTKEASKEHAAPVSPDSQLLRVNGRRVDILRSLPGEQDFGTLARNALFAEAGSTSNLFNQFSAHLGANYRMSGGSLIHRSEQGYEDADAIGKWQAHRLFNRGVVGGQNVRVFDELAQQTLESKFAPATWSGQRISAEVVSQYRGQTFEHGGKPYEILSGLEQQDDGSYIGDFTTLAAVTSKLERFRPEFDRGRHILRAEMLENMAYSNPGLYRNLMDRDRRGEFTNNARELVSAVTANVNPGALQRLEERGGIVDFGQLGVGEHIAGLPATEDPTEATLNLMRAVAGGEYGNKAIRLGGSILPSARSALATVTENRDGGLVKNFGSMWAGAIYAGQAAQEAEELGMTGGGERRARDIAAYDATLAAAELADSPETIKRMAGIEMDMLGGPAIAHGGVLPNEAVMTRRQLFEQSGVYAFQGEEREMAKQMALEAAASGDQSFMMTMFPHVNPDEAYPNFKISLLDEVRQREGMGDLADPSETGNMWISPITSMYFRKDQDADPIYGAATRRIVRGANGLEWTGERLDITPEDRMVAHARKSQEWLELRKQAERDVSSYFGEAMSSRQVGAKKGTVRTFEEIQQGAPDYVGFLSMSEAKQQIGPLYNMSLRTHLAFARSQGEDYVAAGGSDANAHAYSQTMSTLGEWTYQKGADYEKIVDEAVLNMQLINQNVKYDSSKFEKRSAYNVREGKAIPYSETLTGLSRWGIEQAINYGRSGEDFADRVAPNLARALLPLNMQDDQAAIDAMYAEITGDNVSANRVAEIAGFKGRLNQYFFGDPNAEAGGNVPFLNVQGGEMYANMVEAAARGKNGAAEKYAEEGSLPGNLRQSGNLVSQIRNFSIFRNAEHGVMAAMNAVLDTPANVFGHTRGVVEGILGGNRPVDSRSLTEQLASHKPESYGGTIESNGTTLNTVDLGVGGQQHIINPRFDVNPELGRQRFSHRVSASMWGMGDTPEARRLNRAAAMVAPKQVSEELRTALGVNPYAGYSGGAAEAGTALHDRFQSMVSQALGMPDQRGVTTEMYVDNPARLSYGMVDMIVPSASGEGVVADLKTMGNKGFQAALSDLNFQQKHGSQVGLYVEGAQHTMGGMFGYTDASGQQQVMSISREFGGIIPMVQPDGEMTDEAIKQQLASAAGQLRPAMAAALNSGQVPSWFGGSAEEWQANLKHSLSTMDTLKQRTGMDIPFVSMGMSGAGGLGAMNDAMMDDIISLSTQMPVHDRSVTNDMTEEAIKSRWSVSDMAQFVRDRTSGKPTSLSSRNVTETAASPTRPRMKWHGRRGDSGGSSDQPGGAAASPQEAGATGFYRNQHGDLVQLGIDPYDKAASDAQWRGEGYEAVRNMGGGDAAAQHPSTRYAPPQIRQDAVDASERYLGVVDDYRNIIDMADGDITRLSTEDRARFKEYRKLHSTARTAAGAYYDRVTNKQFAGTAKSGTAGVFGDLVGGLHGAGYEAIEDPEWAGRASSLNMQLQDIEMEERIGRAGARGPKAVYTTMRDEARAEQAIDKLTNLKDVLGELTKATEGATKVTRQQADQLKDFTKTGEDLERVYAKLSKPGAQLDDAQQALKGRIEGVVQATGDDMRKVEAISASIRSGDVAVGLETEEAQMRLTELLLRGGRGGVRARQDPKNQELYDAGLDLGFGKPLTNRAAIDAIGAGMRLSSRMQNTLWGMSHVQRQLIEPMVQAADFYQTRESERQMAMAQSGIISYDDMMGGQYGRMRVRQARGEGFQEELGRQVYTSYAGILDSGGGEALGRQAGALAAIGTPAVAGSIFGNALGSPKMGAILGGIGAVGGLLNYFTQSTQDTQGLAATSSMLMENYNNVTNVGRAGVALGGVANLLGPRNIAAATQTFFQDPLGATSLALAGIFNRPAVERSAELSALDYASRDYILGVGGHSQASMADFSSNAVNTGLFNRGEVNESMLSSYLDVMRERGVGQTEALGHYQFYQSYGQSRHISDPIFESMRKYASVGVYNLPQTAINLAQARGASPTDDQAVMSGAADLNEHFAAIERRNAWAEERGYSNLIVNPILEGQRAEAGIAAMGQLRQSAIAAGMPFDENYWERYTTGNAAGVVGDLADDPVAQQMDFAAQQQGFARRTAYQGFADATQDMYQSQVDKYTRRRDSLGLTQYLGRDQMAQGFFSQRRAYGPISEYNARRMQQMAGGMNDEDFARAYATISGDSIAVSQNWRDFIGGRAPDGRTLNAADAVMYQQFDYTGQQSMMYNMTDLQRQGVMQYANRFGLGDMATALPGITSMRDAQHELWQIGKSEQERQFQMQRDQFQLSVGMQTGGATQLDSQGYAKLGDGLKAMAEVFERNGMNFNTGNGMGVWQIQDASTALNREQQMFNLQQSGQGVGLQQAQFDLAAKQFYERYNLNVEQFEYGTGYQRREMQIGRRQSLQQREWQREDMSYQRSQAEIGFGWSMEDYDRNLRYARGRERQDLLRQRDRAVISQSMQMGQMDRQEGRFEERAGWEDQQFERQKKHFEQTTQFREQEMEMQKRHFEEGRALDEQRLQMTQQSHEKQVQWLQQEWALQDQQRVLERQATQIENKMRQDNMNATQEAARRTMELNAALQLMGEAARHASNELRYAASIGTSIDMYSGASSSSASSNGAAGPVTSNAAHQYDFSFGGFRKALGYANGGYTGDGGKYDFAGVVHKGEYVVPQQGAAVIRGDNPESVALLSRMLAVLEKIAANPAQVNAVINTNQSQVRVADFTQKDRAYARLKN